MANLPTDRADKIVWLLIGLTGAGDIRLGRWKGGTWRWEESEREREEREREREGELTKMFLPTLNS